MTSAATAAVPIDTAMLLAAGRGSRLRPLTDHTPKPLVEVDGETLIARHLRRLAAAGVRRVVINLNHLGEQIRLAVGDGSKWQLEVHYSEEPGAALETAGGIRHALPLLDRERFLLVNGDVFCDAPLAPLLLQPATDVDLHLLLVDRPAWLADGDFDLGAPWPQAPEPGTRALLRGSVRPLTYSGMAVLRSAALARLAPGRRPLLPVMKQAIAAGRASGARHEGFWEDVGTLERLEALRRMLADPARRPPLLE